MKAAIIAGCVSLSVLSIASTAHANPDAPYPKAVKTLKCTGTQCREKAAGIARECPIKISANGKPENEREIKNCVKNWNATIAYPAKGHWIWRWFPPAEYDKPYEGVLMTQRLPIDQLHKVCAPGQMACAMPISIGPNGKGWQISLTGNRAACLILMPSDSYLWEHHQDPKDTIRHEIGHCNGWPGDHPNSQSKWEWVEK